MASLDEWTEKNIIFPLFEVARGYDKGGVKAEEAIWQIHDTIKKLVREKVLKSYRNGQTSKKEYLKNK